MAKIEQKKLFEAFMGDVKPQIDTVMNAYKSEYKVESKQKGSLFESFDSSKPKIAIFEGTNFTNDLAEEQRQKINQEFHEFINSFVIDPSIIEADVTRFVTEQADTPTRLKELLKGLSGETSDINTNKSKIFLLAILFNIINKLNHSAGGFAFEHFIAGMTGGRVVMSEFLDKAADVASGEYKYQAKFLSAKPKSIPLSSNYKSVTTNQSKVRFWFVIGVKTSDGVEFCLVPYNNEVGTLPVPNDAEWFELKMSEINKLIDISFIQPILDSIHNAGVLIDDIKDYAGKINTSNKSKLSKNKIQQSYDQTGKSLGIK